MKKKYRRIFHQPPHVDRDDIDESFNDDYIDDDDSVERYDDDDNDAKRKSNLMINSEKFSLRCSKSTTNDVPPSFMLLKLAKDFPG